MKVVSKFTDYYDRVRGVDRDDEPLYLRHTVEHDLTAPRTAAARRALLDAIGPLWTTETMPPEPPAGERAVIAFCGRLHPLYLTDELRPRPLYTAEQIARAFHLAAEERARPARRWERVGLSRTTWERYRRGLPESVGDAPFLHFGAPVIFVSDQRIVVNPPLRPLLFSAVVDPFTAWQELSMFLGNNLVVARREPRPVSDALKAHAHGFDDRSFRKHKDRKKVDRSEW